MVSPCTLIPLFARPPLASCAAGVQFRLLPLPFSGTDVLVAGPTIQWPVPSDRDKSLCDRDEGHRSYDDPEEDALEEWSDSDGLQRLL